MWVHLPKEKEFRYILSEEIVCFVKRIEVKIPRHGLLQTCLQSSCSMQRVKMYRAGVYCKNESSADEWERYSVSPMYGEDLEIMKLQCLIRAKELGWDIKSIEV